MKKLYTLAVIALLGINNSYSQNHLSLAPHSTLNYSGPAASSLTATFSIINNGTDSLDVIAKMDHRTLAPSHYSYFCWTVCYDTGTFVSPQTISVGPGGSIPNFEGWLGTQNTGGHDEVTYEFYDNNGLSDTLTVTVIYDFAAPNGINEISGSRYVFNISGANPANNFTKINYIVPEQKDARIIVTNLLGSKISDIHLNSRNTSITFSIADLPSGVYIYSLVVDGTITNSRKLIVEHQ